MKVEGLVNLTVCNVTDLRFDINIDDLTTALGKVKEDLSEDIKKGAGDLASMTHAKTLELARNNLNSLQKIYTDNVEFSNPEENLWVVTLKEPAMWIEEGRKSGSMVDDLLRKGYKTSKDGNKYRAIPFEHSKPPSQQSNAANELTNLIRKELRARNINYKKIEYGKNGSPRVGLLHRFDVESARKMSDKQKEQLKGVAVYQTKQKDGSVRRDVMTFRIVSEKHKDEGKWMHPGRQAEKFMDEAFDWAVRTWETEMLPAILSKYE